MKLIMTYAKFSVWWYTYPSEKYDFVGWDCYPEVNGKTTHIPNHQPDTYPIIISPYYEVDYDICDIIGLVVYLPL